MEIILPTGESIVLESEMFPAVSEETGYKTFLFSVSTQGCLAFVITQQQQAKIAPYLTWVLRAIKAETHATMTCVVRIDPWYLENGSVATINHALFREVLPDRRKLYSLLIEWLEYMSFYSQSVRNPGRLKDVMVLDGNTTTIRRMTNTDHLLLWWMKGKIVYDKLD